VSDKKAAEIALTLLNDGIQQCDSEEEISLMAQALIIISTKIINGVDGHKFKTGFMSEAIKDQEKISPIQRH